MYQQFMNKILLFLNGQKGQLPQKKKFHGKLYRYFFSNTVFLFSQDILPPSQKKF